MKDVNVLAAAAPVVEVQRRLTRNAGLARHHDRQQNLKRNWPPIPHAVWRSWAGSKENTGQLPVAGHGVLAVGGEHLYPDVVGTRLELGVQARRDAVGRAV